MQYLPEALGSLLAYISSPVEGQCLFLNRSWERLSWLITVTMGMESSD